MSVLTFFGPKRPLQRDIKAQRSRSCDDYTNSIEFDDFYRILDNLNRLPLIDTSGSVAFKERILDFIAKSDDEDVKKVHVLTNIDLKSRLIHATHCLEAELHDANWTAITMNMEACRARMDTFATLQEFQVHFKSNDWIMRNALEYLSKHPYCVYERHHMDLHRVGPLVNVVVDTYVLFDDAAYSGTQLRQTLFDDGISYLMNMKRLFIICLFMTKEALHKIKCTILDGLRHGVNSDVFLEDWDEFKPPQELNKTHLIREDECWFVYHNTVTGFDVYLYKPQMIENMVTLFEHKLPDYASFNPDVGIKLLHLLPLPPYKDASKMVDDYNEDEALDLPCVGHYIDKVAENRKTQRTDD
jgi:hypothetical protein